MRTKSGRPDCGARRVTKQRTSHARYIDIERSSVRERVGSASLPGCDAGQIPP